MSHAMKTTGKPSNSGSKQLFSNPVLEKLTRTHIAVPVSIFVVFSLFLLGLAYKMADLPPATIILLFGTGLLVFTLTEYLMHRFIYHMKAGGPRLRRLQYLMHGVHHDYPKDKSRLAMPPVVSIIVAAFLLGSTYLLLGEFTFAFLPGFILGYSAYLFVHYIVHAYRPPQNSFRTLWIHHSIHHYKDAGRAFGVSSPLWDYVFGTMPEKTKK